MPAAGFLRSRPDQLAWQATVMRTIADRRCRGQRTRAVRQAGALEVFVHSPDRDGLFAAIVATLDRLGCAIQQARLLDGPAGNVFDIFEVVPTDAHARRSA